MTYSGSWTSHVFSILVPPAPTEPLTLDEAKLRAGLDWAAGDPRDALMNDFISAARSKVEHDTGLALLTQTRDLFYDGGPLYGQPLLLVGPQCRPLQSITSVTPIDPTVTPHPGMPRTSVPWPVVVEGEAVTIRLVAGWLDVAALRADAPLLLQAVGLLVAHYATIGRDLASVDTITEIPFGYCDAIAPYVPAMAP